MYSAIAKCRNHNLSIDCKLDIFDKAIKPILLYACEVWGFCDNKLLERLHLKFCKHILKLKTSTPNFMVFGEVGRFPLSINIKVRMIGFWTKMIESSHNKLSCKLFQICNNYNTQWSNCIKNIFEECNLVHIFENQEFINVKWLKSCIFYTLKNKFISDWKNEVFNSPKGTNYRIYKHDLILEQYLFNLPPRLAKIYCKFRTCNIKLPVECSRWNNIPRENRICNLCNLNEIGDEFHYLFNCSDQEILINRKKFLSRYYFESPSTFKFNTLFNYVVNDELISLVKFINIINCRLN